MMESGTKLESICQKNSLRSGEVQDSRTNLSLHSSDQHFDGKTTPGRRNADDLDRVCVLLSDSAGFSVS